MLLHINFERYQLVPQCSPKTPVTICNIKKWDKTDAVIEVLPDQQYHIHLDGSGSSTLQNHRFLQPHHKVNDSAIIPTAVSDQSDTSNHNDHFATPVVHHTINEHLMANVPEVHNNPVPLPLPTIPPSDVSRQNLGIAVLEKQVGI